MSSPSTNAPKEERFSVALFLLTVGVSLGVLCGALALLAPKVWQAQLEASWLALLGVFLVAHVGAAFFEFFFHRYVLHAPLVAGLSYFYRQHTHHHALTRVTYQRTGRSQAVVPCLVEVHNRFPIEQDEQREASFFPWYTLIAFAVAPMPLLILAQWLFPSIPILLGTWLGLAWSLVLYELIHAVEHWPQATWDRLTSHPRWGGLCRKAYAFHLRHHADIRCNEAISGVFGLPVVDWLFGTYVDPATLYPTGKAIDLKEFSSPRPRIGLVRWLDSQADAAVRRRRERRAAA